MVQPNLPHSSLASVRMLAKEKDAGRSFVHPFNLSLYQVISVNPNLFPHANPIIQYLARTSEKNVLSLTVARIIFPVVFFAWPVVPRLWKP